ncbi:MAG: AI-2E family transporter [Richelia sp. RM2_1_2]|nr:AI-2E family transporter [Richelia sp. SM2_1_7]NJN09019.1 AI-2E family transporter [Richelia sp. RM1_1_1]NJO27068.1 AI-2E family transporter [Richelia sp. SL_2_1]NJO57174.1 AI-2E family transporter [Richelia sp. RM2_1_2]
MQSAFKLPRWLSLGLAFPLFILNIWVLLGVIKYLQPLVSIVIAAILLAFVLEYPIGFFQRRGVERNLATVGVLLLAVVILGGFGITVLPLIIEQVNELINILPAWIDSGTQQLQALQDWAATQQLPINPSGLLPDLLDKISNRIQSLSGRIIGLAFDTIGSVLNILLTAVLTLYMILNGDRVWEGILKWLPQHIAKQVSDSLREDFQNYFIGQATLATILATGLTLAFVGLRVPLNLLFALVIGFFALFPFGTGIGITLVSLLVGLKNFWLGVEVLSVAVAIDQFNYNFIAPRILSNFTGLNPVWVVISLLIGAKLLGVLGLLIAIPLASFIKSVADNWRDGGFIMVNDRELEAVAESD